MQGCKDVSRLFGGQVQALWAFGCANEVPDEEEFRIIGLGTGKTVDLNPNTTTSSADNDYGVVENLVTSIDPAVSFDGEIDKNADPGILSFQELFKYYTQEMMAKRQPTGWIRWMAGGVMMQYYSVATGLSEDGSRDDITTWSGEFKVASADTFTVEDVIGVTGLTVPATTVSIEVGGTYDINPTFEPANASTQVAQYKSSKESVATVDYKGVITPVAAGTTTITVRSVDGGYKQTIAVTVTESGSQFQRSDIR